MMGELIFSIGINDADYTIRSMKNGKQINCKFYTTWYHMLERCYSDKFHEKRPTYIDCTVVEEWHIFSIFKEWMEKQDWEGKYLDKDILVEGNKIYSPDTCIFVTNQINNLFNNHASARGACPQGVSKFKHRYKAQINKYSEGVFIGCFDDVADAERAYLVVKSLYVAELAEEEFGLLRYALLDRAKNMMNRSQSIESKND